MVEENERSLEEENLESPSDSAENIEEEVVEETPAPAPKPRPAPVVREDHDEVAGLRAQMERMREDLDRERETSRVLQHYVQQQQVQKPKAQADDEYAEVDKALGPWIRRVLQPYVDDLTKVLSGYHDR